MNYSLLYRGWLSSCNYSCEYCPFAKRVDSRTQLRRDRDSLAQFVAWAEQQSTDQWDILFTPWGEALVRPWYRAAMARLSHMPHVRCVSAQTNLSCSIAWIADCRLDRFSLWATYHPTEVDASAFVAKVLRLRTLGVQLSVGMVAVPGALDRVQAMRERLPPEVYLWLNSQQPRRTPFSAEEVAGFREIDPHFGLTLRPQRSRGLPCRTGENAFTVDGKGDIRRCHFVDDVIGSIHTSDWRSALRPRACPKATCTCFLGIAPMRSHEPHPYAARTSLAQQNCSLRET
jgi:hypothetical protein